MITSYIYQAFLLVYTVCCVFFYLELKKYLWYITLLVVVSFIFESIGLYSLVYENKVAVNVFHIYQPIEYVLHVLYFLSIIKERWIVSLAKKLVYLYVPLLLFVGFAGDKYDLSNRLPFLMVTLIVIPLCIFYLSQLLKQDVYLSLKDNPNFFIVTGMLLFRTGTFFVMALVNHIAKTNIELARGIFSINHVLNIIYYGLLTYGLYVAWKVRK